MVFSNFLFKFCIVYQQAVLLAGKLFQHWLQVVVPKLFFVEQLQDVFELLVCYEPVFVPIDGPNGTKDFNQVVFLRENIN